jgi:site-specific DNA-methyltransferase (adenine-specific)
LEEYKGANWTLQCADARAFKPSEDQLAKLCIADPPYNLNKSYELTRDDLSEVDYLEFSRSWLRATSAAVAKGGSLFVFLPDEWAADLDVHVRRKLLMRRRAWIIWAYGFGVSSQGNWARAHTHILQYCWHKSYTFNADSVRIASNRQITYGDKRANAAGKVPDNVWVLTREAMESVLPVDGDVWYRSRICGTFKERRRYSSNQIPLAILERIILASSNPGDLVYDPFCGTCGCGEVALRHGRRYLGRDVSPTCIEEGVRRLSSLEESLKGGSPCIPVAPCAAPSE